MPLTNREIVERAFAALDRRDLQGFLDLVDPDMEFTSLIAEAEGHTFRGHDGLRGVTGTAGGVAVSQTMYQVIRVQEGKAVSWHLFRTREEAMAAVEAGK